MLWLLAFLTVLPNEMRAWAPILAIGDEPRQVESAIAKTERLHSLTRAAYLERRLDDETQQLVDEMQEKISTLDPKALYAMVGERGVKDGDRHVFTVWGEMQAKGDYRISAQRESRVPRFSHMTGTLALKPGEKTDRYFVSTEVALHLDMGARDFTAFWGGVADWLQTTAPSARRGRDPGDQAVLAGLAEAFPNTGALIARYFDTTDVVATANEEPWLMLRPTFDSDLFARDYPAIGGVMASRGGQSGGMRARWRLVNAEGKTLAMTRFDKGGFFALDPGMMRLPEGAYRLEGEAGMDLAGLSMKMTDLFVDVTISRKGGASIEYRMHEVPKIRVTGALLDLVSVELIDSLIPSEMETIIRDFYAALAEGDGGHGASYRFSVPDDPSQPIRIETRFTMLDNGFVSFWLKQGSRMVTRSEATKTEVRQLTDKMLTAFGTDFARFQEKVLVQ